MKQHRSNRNSRKRPQTSSHIPVSEQYSNNSQEDARRVATNQEDKDMCRTMKELERVVADYRSMKAMKEQMQRLKVLNMKSSAIWMLMKS